MEITEEICKQIAKTIWSQGDNFYAKRARKGKWIIGYTNDYPMQHGDGHEITVPSDVVEMLYESHLLRTGTSIQKKEVEILSALTIIGDFYFHKRDHTSSTQIALAKDVVQDYYIENI